MSRFQAIVVALSILSAVPAAIPLATVRPLAAGRVAILGGAVERTLRNGVVITLEGPGEFELRGELSVFLHAGSAVVRMPKGMSGFRLDTATTNVQVFDGTVVASSMSASDNASFPTRIEAGEAGRLDDWRLAPGFTSSRDGTDSCPEWVDGRMMYDDGHIYIAAHVGDPPPMQNSIDPAIESDLGWRGGSVQVRVSTDRHMGWPVADNPMLSHLTTWFHAASKTPCLTIHRGMLVGELEVNPSAGQPGGYHGAFTRDADGKGYILEYAIPWRLLNCADDPPRSSDELAAVWQTHWSDELGHLQREHMVEIRNLLEPREINVWERGATWGGRSIIAGILSSMGDRCITFSISCKPEAHARGDVLGGVAGFHCLYCRLGWG